jgi:hypothetical protein
MKILPSRHPIWVRSIFVLLWAALLSGCEVLETKEATRDLDFVVGGDYRVPFRVMEPIQPRSLFLMPIESSVPETYTATFRSDFLGHLERNATFAVVPWDRYPNRRANPRMARADWVEYARGLGCDALLYIKLGPSQPYPPLRLNVTIGVEQLDVVGSAALANADYDAAQRLVANSARRFYQQRMQRATVLDKSMHILQNMDMFTRFVAQHAAAGLIQVFAPPPY